VSVTSEVAMTTEFGCAYCYGDDAQAVSVYYDNGGLETERLIVDDPHFLVSLPRCRRCAQGFVSIFTEFVDWEGGDDAQYRDVVPVTPAETAIVVEQGEDVDLRYLGSLGEGRRRLSTDWPTGDQKADRMEGRHVLGEQGH
jgi:hypothetical protein